MKKQLSIFLFIILSLIAILSTTKSIVQIEASQNGAIYNSTVSQVRMLNADGSYGGNLDADLYGNGAPLNGANDYTTETVVNAGFRSAHTIYPGKDDFEHIQPDNSIIERYGLSGKKWLLFTGAPAAYRGADLLVKAVDESSNDSIRLVMLMRTDVGSDYERFNHLLSSIKHPERIIVIKDKLSREQLRTFFGQAWYGVLPFIVIPSEIPLTYFEILSCGTPIISFENGGTSKYLKEALLIADKTINGLTRAIEHAWNDEHLKQRLSENGYKLMQNHPTWESVGKQWMDLIEKRK